MADFQTFKNSYSWHYEFPTPIEVFSRLDSDKKSLWQRLKESRKDIGPAERDGEAAAALSGEIVETYKVKGSVYT